MWKSLPKNLLFSCLVIVLLSSCSPSLFNKFRRNSGLAEKSHSWFEVNGESMLCRASIRAWSSEFTGIMIIKPVAGSYRCLFMTETGMKIFDLEVREDGSHVMHYCLEELNRKSVVKLLADDFGMMIFPFPHKGKTEMMREGKEGPVVFRAKDKRGTRYIWIGEQGKISRLIHSGTFFKKFEITFTGNGTRPDTVRIKHNFLKIAINLSLIDDIS